MCLDCPTSDLKDTVRTGYCSKACQIEHANLHSSTCKAARQRAYLERTTDVLQALISMYRLHMLHVPVVGAQHKDQETVILVDHRRSHTVAPTGLTCDISDQFWESTGILSRDIVLSYNASGESLAFVSMPIILEISQRQLPRPLHTWLKTDL